MFAGMFVAHADNLGALIFVVNRCNMPNMLRKLFLFLVLILSGCSAALQSVDQKMEIFEIIYEEKPYYFYYPSGSILEEKEDGSVDILFENGCKISTGLKIDDQMENYPNFELVQRNDGSMTYEAWYFNDSVGFYRAYYDFGGTNYLFEINQFPQEQGIEACMDSVDQAVESLTEVLTYVNEDFGFQVDLFADYKVEYLPNGSGVVMRRWVEPYAVEMGAFAEENLLEWEDLGGFLAEKYPGYTTEFFGEGVYVDERNGEEAIRHFFRMNEEKDIVYEVYLKVPAKYYTEYLAVFGLFVGTMEVF